LFRQKKPLTQRTPLFPRSKAFGVGYPCIESVSVVFSIYIVSFRHDSFERIVE
jgi:hypothetical protein